MARSPLVLRGLTLKHHTPREEIGCRDPAGVRPRRGLRRWTAVIVGACPPLFPETREIRQREAEETFDFSKCQHDGVRESVIQVLVQRPILHWLPGCLRQSSLVHLTPTVPDPASVDCPLEHTCCGASTIVRKIAFFLESSESHADILLVDRSGSPTRSVRRCRPIKKTHYRL